MRRENKGSPSFTEAVSHCSVHPHWEESYLQIIKGGERGWRGGEDPCLKEQGEFGGPSGRWCEIYEQFEGRGDWIS